MSFNLAPFISILFVCSLKIIFVNPGFEDKRCWYGVGSTVQSKYIPHIFQMEENIQN